MKNSLRSFDDLRSRISKVAGALPLVGFSYNFTFVRRFVIASLEPLELFLQSLEFLRHHVEEEEGEMFKKARKVLSNEASETLGSRMEKAKGEQEKASAAR